LVKVFTLRIVQVHGAGQTRVKGMNGPDNFNRLLEAGHWRTDKRLLKR
jgi:hypothetical protein